MKPERSELEMVEVEEQKPRGLVASVARALFGGLLRKAVITGVRFLTRRWAPKVGGQEEGGAETDD